MSTHLLGPPLPFRSQAMPSCSRVLFASPRIYTIFFDLNRSNIGQVNKVNIFDRVCAISVAILYVLPWMSGVTPAHVEHWIPSESSAPALLFLNKRDRDCESDECDGRQWAMIELIRFKESKVERSAETAVQ